MLASLFTFRSRTASSPSRIPPGRGVAPGRAPDFAGVDDYGVSPATAADRWIGGGNSKSVSAWVYARSFAQEGGVFDLGDSALAGRNFALTTGTTPNEWRIQLGGGTVSSITCDSDNKWTHLVVTYNGMDVKLWSNAVQNVTSAQILNTTSDVALSGTVTFNYGSNAVDGTAGTLFQTEVRRGDVVRLNVGDAWRVVDQVISDTEFTLVANYPGPSFDITTDQTTNQSLGNVVGYNDRIAMSFQFPTDATVTDVSACLAKTGTPGDISVRIENDLPVPGEPSGALVVPAAFGTITEAAVGAAGSWVSSSLGGPVALTAGTTYWLVLQLPADPLAGSYYAASGEAADSYLGGKYMYRTGAVWADGAEILDMAFRLGISGTAQRGLTFRVGEWNGNSFDGLIDDVRVYDRALDAEEVNWIYSAGPGPAYHKPVVEFGSDQVDPDLREGFGVTWDPAEVIDANGAIAILDEIYIVTPPAGVPEAVDVKVTNPDGGTFTLTGGFYYRPPPIIYSIDPDLGGEDTSITIHGDFFERGYMEVWFGTEQSQSVSWGTGTSWCYARPPPQAAGTTFVYVIVRTDVSAARPQGQWYSTESIGVFPGVRFEYDDQ